MVHINKVEIFGFKSFGFKNTIVDFQPGLVSISGPNGSGKSNILDAIIFAMGENRPKTMRVDKLRSLLHDIEGARRGPKMTRVSVHFDNSDRQIPIDSDAVEITREMDGQGENIYYLNKKKTNRSHVLDLLDMANAGLHQLNAVQQGTVTRISEFSPEEKREAIENLIGLSYFDEKKAESQKQLDEADRRLDIALAKIGEIKKRIDELEEERNLKLRHEMLERELNRLRAILASNKLQIILEQKDTKEKQRSQLDSQKTTLDQEKNTIQEDIKKQESEKTKFMEKVNAYNQAKATIDTELSQAMQDFEEANTGIIAAKKHIEQINSRIPEIDQEIANIHTQRHAIESDIQKIRQELEQSNSEKLKIDEEVKSLNSQISIVFKQQADVLNKKSQFDQKIKDLNDKLNASKLKFSQLQSDANDITNKIHDNSLKHNSYAQESKQLLDQQTRLKSITNNLQNTTAQIKPKLSKLAAKKEKTEKDIDELNLILEKSSKAGNQYDAKIRLVKGIMHEDYSTAKLKENAQELGILGLVYELVSWNKENERAILAVSSDWIKATVVKDFGTLVSLAEYVRYKKLPKLKIIPLEAIPKFTLDLPNQKGIIGVLSDYVQCDSKYSALKTFLFGNVILADSKESAYKLSKSGYKAVTLEGEFFESNAAAVVIDINSKISKLTKIISMSTSVDGLLSSVSLLKKYVQKKKNTLKKTEASIQSYQQKLQSAENKLAKENSLSDMIQLKINDASKVMGRLSERISELNRRKTYLESETAKQESYMSSLEQRISLVRENYSDGELHRIASELERLNSKKSSLDIRQDEITQNYRNKTSQAADLDAQETREKTIIRNLDGEKERIKTQRAELESKIENLTQEKELKNQNLIKLREKEQELISTSGTSVGKLAEYDEKLHELNGHDRSLAKNINSIERQTDSLSRDLRDLDERHVQIQTSLNSFGFGGKMEYFDVEPVLQALEAEQKSLGALNAKAPETYLEVSNGYRSMSTRKNSLEEERNSIVRFIEEIEKDKRQTFLDAFDKVDKEIRHAFSKMTGGNAWLELQNEDDIFSSGISYVIQFPNKPKRESTSISGGEKTLAAIVFVLALQKLKPSPFYLFDEVDAHLDAPNSERLSKILEERAKESQFIMVSLKDSVVQKAKLIYGVYPRNGVSQVVTYKDKRLPSMTTN